jgi:DNA-binding transcriptional MerR regulator
MKLSATDLNKRLPVWVQLTALFTDNELDETEKLQLAKQLQNSGFSLLEIEAILRDEVLPAFASNLSSAAGNWTGWSAEEVRQRVEKQLEHGVANSMQWWRKRRLKSLVGDDWHQVKELLAKNFQIDLGVPKEK